MSTDVATRQTNPFPGLRPFDKNEEYLFFGRESQVNAMVDKLAATHFLAVVGTSGSGKSSLVNCGLRPGLHGGLMTSAGTAWHIVRFRPGSNPFEAMAQALAGQEGLFEPSFAKIVETTLRMSKRGLIEIYQQARLDEHVNLLLVVDQFEELFRYGMDNASQNGQALGGNEDVIAFVNLLLEVRKEAIRQQPMDKQQPFRVFVAITMRSDFLGDCAQFQGLPEAINDGEYLVPRMSRDERRSAIAGPIVVFDAQVTPVLLTRLINDVGDNPDQLSILQHALNRTWARWKKVTTFNEAHALASDQRKAFLDKTCDGDEALRREVELLLEAWPIFERVRALVPDQRAAFLDQACNGKDILRREVVSLLDTHDDILHSSGTSSAIDLPHYEAIGTMAHALDKHAEKAYAELDSPRKEKICEKIFKALTDGRDVRGVRRPTKLGALCALVQPGAEEVMSDIETDREKEVDREEDVISEEEIIEVINVFRKPSRSFLMPPVPETLEAESIIDISHESLMRVWNRLIRWADEEAESVRMYRRLADDGALHEKGRTGVWRDPELQLALDWTKKEQPTETWAQRYHPGFEGAMAFLKKSLAQRKAEADEEEAQRKKELAHVTALAEAERLRAEEQRKRFRIAAVLAIVAVGLAVLAALLWFNANTLRATAETARQQAVEAQAEAETAREDAVREKVEADRQRALAESNATMALQAQKTADTQRQLAQVNYLTAEQQRQIAERLLDSLAIVQDDLQDALIAAQDNLAEAVRQKANADSALQIADTERKKTLGLSLASRAKRRLARLDIAKRNALLAREAYLFNDISGGDFLSEVYDALRTTLNELNELKERQDDSLRGGPMPLGPAHDTWVKSVAYSADSRWVATSSSDGAMYLRPAGTPDAAPIELKVSVNAAQPVLRPLAFSPEGPQLASVGDRETLWLWDGLGEDARSRKLGDHGSQVRAIAFGSTMLASAGDDGAVRLWHERTGLSGTLRGHQGAVRAVAISPDGTRLASAGDDGTVRVWDVATGEQLDLLRSHEGAVHAVAFSPTKGTLLATGGKDGMVHLWDWTTGEQYPLRGHVGPVNVVAFSPDGQRLASGSSDHQVRLWEVSDLTNLTRYPIILEGHTNWVESLAFSPDGTTLVSGSADKTILRWNIDVKMLADLVCKAVGYEDLSPGDWDLYVPGVEYRPTCSKEAPGQASLRPLPNEARVNAVRRERAVDHGAWLLSVRPGL